VTSAGLLVTARLGSTMLEASERSELLGVAEVSIARGLDGHSQLLPERNWSPSLLELRATFTTLMIRGELRGCCGTIEPQRPLVYDVWRTAWSSAYADPRFWPVTSEEISSLEISISVLTPLELLPARTDAELIACLQPGVDGLVLRHGTRCATFLPSVWESLPDPHLFLEQLKKKASWSYAGDVWPAEVTALRYGTETIHSRRTSMLAA
jgi:AmmeMemoRadiSam system protein A